MDPVDKILRQELTELLDRVAEVVSNASNPTSRHPTFKARLDRADANLVAARAVLLEGYGRWNRALEDVENLWALAAWRSTQAEEPASTKSSDGSGR